ncbi:MAG: glycosyltransferase family 39 protein, partial [Longimicrobiales bacterium]
EALLAAALLAVSYHHIWFSQNARGYTMLAFFAMLATHLLLRGVRHGRRRDFVGYAVAVALGIFTHLTMVFVVAAHVLICAWLAFVMPRERRLDWRLPLLGFTVGGVLTLALYAPIMTQVLAWFLHRPSKLLGVSTPAWALREGLQMLRVGLGAGWTVVAGAAVFAIGLAAYLRRSPLTFALFVLPGATTLAGALLGRGTMYPRFYFFLIGFALLIVVRGAGVIGAAIARVAGQRDAETAGESRRTDQAAPGERIATAFVGLMIVASMLSLRYNYAYPKQAFQAAAAHVESSARPDEPVAVINATWYAYMEYYGKPWTRITSGEELDALRRSGRMVWL